MSADVIPIRPGVRLLRNAPQRRSDRATEHIVGLRGNVVGGFERLKRVLAGGGLRCWYDPVTRSVVVEDESHSERRP